MLLGIYNHSICLIVTNDAISPFVEEKMVQTTNKIMALTAELRVGAETAAEMLQEFGNYIVDIVNKGTLFLRKQYDESVRATVVVSRARC